MILEHAIFAITPGSEQDFEAAIEQAKEVIAQAEGFQLLQAAARDRAAFDVPAADRVGQRRGPHAGLS